MESLNRRELFLGTLAAACGFAADSKRLHVGCHTNAWKIEVPEFHNLLKVLEEAKAAGYEGFETGYYNVQGQFENVKEAREQLRASGMRFFGCHIFQFDYDPKTNIPAWELLQRIGEGVSKLGAERLIVSGAAVGNDPERLHWKVGALSRAGRLCRSLNMERLSYHNHAAEFEDSGFEMITLIKESDPDTTRFVIDCGDALGAKVNLSEFFTKYHKRIEGLHVHVVDGAEAYAGLAAAVKKTNWQGWIIAEEENGDGPGRTAMDPARANVRAVFGV